jgi:hypothetical protein
MASVVESAVLSAETIVEKNLPLWRGIYNYFSCRYGTRQPQPKPRVRKRKKKPDITIKELRLQRNKLRNELRRAKKSGQSPDVISTIAQKFHQLLCQYSSASRADRRAAELQRARRERKECARNLNGFAREVLEGKKSNRDCEPAFDAQSAQEYFEKIYDSGEKEFSCPSWLPEAPSPKYPFDEGPLLSDELARVLKKVKLRSSPCPLDWVTYLVLRHCPSLQQAGSFQ